MTRNWIALIVCQNQIVLKVSLPLGWGGGGWYFTVHLLCYDAHAGQNLFIFFIVIHELCLVSNTVALKLLVLFTLNGHY